MPCVHGGNDLPACLRPKRRTLMLMLTTILLYATMLFLEAFSSVQVMFLHVRVGC